MTLKRVKVEIDAEIWKRFRQLAIKEDVRVHMLWNEALAVYLKWMKQAEIDERKEAGKVQEVTSLQIEQLETQRIIEFWRREQIKYKKEQYWKQFEYWKREGNNNKKRPI
jgi:predicted transcriptional regulator